MSMEQPLEARIGLPSAEGRLVQLSLAQLRSYRAQLREEEHRVSYWRRLLQARLDMVAAGRLAGGLLTRRQVMTALGDGVARRERLALLALDAGDELPELARLWATPLSMTGDASEAAIIDGLADAEASLSEYRHGLHRLLDAATQELIRRYRADPTLCLDVLPRVPPASLSA